MQLFLLCPIITLRYSIGSAVSKTLPFRYSRTGMAFLPGFFIASIRSKPSPNRKTIPMFETDKTVPGFAFSYTSSSISIPLCPGSTARAFVITSRSPPFIT